MLGVGVGLSGSLMTRKALPLVLTGHSPLGAALIGAKLLWHAVALTVAAVFSREALLWMAGGDLASLFAFVAYQYLSGKKG